MHDETVSAVRTMTTDLERLADSRKVKFVFRICTKLATGKFVSWDDVKEVWNLVWDEDEKEAARRAQAKPSR